MRKGRLNQPAAELAQRYSESVSFDWLLYPYDIAGSIAHAAGLARAGIITTDEREQIEKRTARDREGDRIWQIRMGRITRRRAHERRSGADETNRGRRREAAQGTQQERSDYARSAALCKS